jgi:hypothetical protein
MKIDDNRVFIMRMTCRGLLGGAQDDREQVEFLRKIGRLPQAAYDEAIKEIELDEKEGQFLREAADLAELINLDVADDTDVRRWEEMQPELNAMIDFDKP